MDWIEVSSGSRFTGIGGRYANSEWRMDTMENAELADQSDDIGEEWN